MNTETNQNHLAKRTFVMKPIGTIWVRGNDQINQPKPWIYRQDKLKQSTPAGLIRANDQSRPIRTTWTEGQINQTQPEEKYLDRFTFRRRSFREPMSQFSIFSFSRLFRDEQMKRNTGENKEAWNTWNICGDLIKWFWKDPLRSAERTGSSCLLRRSQLDSPQGSSHSPTRWNCNSEQLVRSGYKILIILSWPHLTKPA